MDMFSNFDAQFADTLSRASGGGNGGYKADPNQFKPNVSDAKPLYQAAVRFVPPIEGPIFVRKVIHYMKFGGRTQRYVCSKTNDPRAFCPICDQNIADNKSKIPALKARAKENGNKVRWLANILVLSDSVNPGNVGKVMYWEMPDQIMNMITAAKNPPNDRIKAFNPFHPIEGADFFMSMSLIDGFPKYEGSQFILPPAPLGDTDCIRQVMSMCHDLTSMVTPSTEDELRDALMKTNGSSPRTFPNMEGQTPAPSLGGFGRFVPPVQQAPQCHPAPLDEFDAAHANAGYAQPEPQPQPQYAQQYAQPTQQAAPKPVMPQARVTVPLQTPESVMPPASSRVTPLPPTPATPQPHPQAGPVVEDLSWLS